MVFESLDAIMCMLWIITYILILISTIKNKYPAIAPIAQAIIFPWEFMALINNFLLGVFFNYAFIAQLLWFIIDLLIIAYILFGIKYYNKYEAILYCLFTIIILFIMYEIFKLPKGMMYTSYINTYIGMVIWFFYIGRENYPKNKINFLIFITKLVADVVGCLVYFGYDRFVSVISIALPVLDFFFIIRFCIKRKVIK